MKTLRLTLCLALLAPALTAQVSISASNVTDGFNNKIASARLCFTPVNAAAQPSGFRVGSQQVVPNEVCGPVTNGALVSGKTVAPSPTGMYYHVYLKASEANTILRDYGMTAITGSAWTLDSYDPNLVTLPVTALSVGTVTTLEPGTGATCNLTGTSPSFLLNCSVPQGVQGPAGTVNGVLSTADFTGQNTSIRIANAITALPTVSGNPVGAITIPPGSTPYNGDGWGGGTNPMPMSPPTGVTVWDFRAATASGYSIGGSILSDGDDWITANATYSPNRAQFEVGSYYHSGNYPNNLYGKSGMISALAVDGTPALPIAADGGQSTLYVMPGFQSAVARGYANGMEANAILEGDQSAAVYRDIYDMRGLTANTLCEPNNLGCWAGIGSMSNIVGQPFQGFAGQNTHFGQAFSVWAQNPGVAQSLLYRTGTATFTNGSGTVTYVSGDRFDNESQINAEILVGGGLYSVTATANGTVAYMVPTFTGATGVYTWRMAGREYSVAANSLWVDTTNPATAITPIDPHGGGGVVLDLAGTSTLGGDPQAGVLTLRQPQLGALLANGTYPRIALEVDNFGGLIFNQPCTTTFTGSISGSTLTVIAAPTTTGIPVGCGTNPLAVGQTVTPAGGIYGDQAYGVIQAFGTGTGGVGTYTLTTNAGTVASTSMVALGLKQVANLTNGGVFANPFSFVVTGGFTGTGAPSNFGQLNAGAISVNGGQFNVATTGAISAPNGTLNIGNGSFAVANSGALSKAGGITEYGNIQIAANNSNLIQFNTASSGQTWGAGLSQCGASCLAAGNGNFGSQNGTFKAGQFSTGSASWTSGAGAPSAGSCTSGTLGSLYTNTNGGASTTLYVCTGPGGTWTAK